MQKTRSGLAARESFRTSAAVAGGLLVMALVAGSAMAAPARDATPTATCASGLSLAAEDEPVWKKWQRGLASWYGAKFHDRRTASGEPFDMNDLTAAHRTLPFGTQVKVRNPRNNRTVVVRINDRGPFGAGRSIDLSKAAASALGILNRGTAQVELLIESSIGSAVAMTERAAGGGAGCGAGD